MQDHVEIAFDELIKIAKQLPPQKWEKLKQEVESSTSNDTEREAFRKLLLNGPVFSEEQLRTIGENRKSMNEWRTR